MLLDYSCDLVRYLSIRNFSKIPTCDFENVFFKYSTHVSPKSYHSLFTNCSICVEKLLKCSKCNGGYIYSLTVKV